MDVIRMIAHQGPVAWTVLGVLALLSLLVWAAIIIKALAFRRSEQGYDRLQQAVTERRRFQEVRTWCWDQEGNPYARLLLAGAAEMEALGGSPAEDATLWRVQREMVERALEQGLRRESSRARRWMPLLATAGNVSPFIGLFGTVLGIMKSFHQIGLEGSASLAVVAPGISEALLATAAGLFAAIPAVIAFIHFRARMISQEYRMRDVTAEAVSILERERLAVLQPAPRPPLVEKERGESGRDRP